MKKFIRSTFCYCSFCLLVFTDNLQAEQQFVIAPSLLRFDYTEYDDFGTTLDSETGWIPGFHMQLRSPINAQQSIELETALYSGSVDYNGQTQSGTPHKTKTNETLFRLGARLHTPLTEDSRLFLGARYHFWGRDINDSNNVFGAYEEYTWWEINVGVKTIFWKKDASFWAAEAAVLRTINPDIHVDLSRFDGGKVDLALGSEWGMRLQLSWLQQKTANWSYGINFFAEQWEFGRSGIDTTSGGSIDISLLEPRSETLHSGIEFILQRHY